MGSAALGVPLHVLAIGSKKAADSVYKLIGNGSAGLCWFLYALAGNRKRTMDSITGEVVPTPSGLLPYRVVFKRNGDMLSEWPVSSVAEGEKQIALAFRSIGKAID
jgi:hypothetical protein